VLFIFVTLDGEVLARKNPQKGQNGIKSEDWERKIKEV